MVVRNKQRKGKPVDVRMDHVEVGCSFRNRFQQYSAGRIGIHTFAAEAQRSWPNRVKLSAGPGIAACEEGHVVTLINQLIDQPSNDPLRTTV
jgi:hypothetical protein